MKKHITVEDFIKNKKFPFGEWCYNPHLKQHVLLADGGVYFYDTNYNLLYKETTLRHMEFVHFVDNDLCVFTVTSSTKVVFFSMSKREIVNRLSLRFSKKAGELIYVESAFFCKEINSLIFYAWYKDEDSQMFGKHGVFVYDLATKLFTNLVCDIGQFARSFNYKNQFAFMKQTKEDVYLYVVNEIAKLHGYNPLTFDFWNQNLVDIITSGKVTAFSIKQEMTKIKEFANSNGIEKYAEQFSEKAKNDLNKAVIDKLNELRVRIKSGEFNGQYA